MENTRKKRFDGFQRGILAAEEICPKADCERLVNELIYICMNTEAFNNSRSNFYNKRQGRAPLSAKETELIDKAFRKYGITDWRGTDNPGKENKKK